MRVLGLYSKALDVLETGLKYLLVAFFAAMTVIAILEVVRRYFFGLSFVWADELCRYILVWMTFLGGCLSFRKNLLVCFDFGYDRLTKRARAALLLASRIISLGFVAFILEKAVSYTFAPVMMNQVSVATRIPQTVVFFSIPLGLFLTVLFALEQLPGIIRDLRRGE